MKKIKPRKPNNIIIFTTLMIILILALRDVIDGRTVETLLTGIIGYYAGKII
jgi:hypothetical protein